MNSWIIITETEESRQTVYEYEDYNDAITAYRKQVRAGRKAKIYTQIPVITLYIETGNCTPQ